MQGFVYKDQLEPVAELGPSGSVVAQFVYGSKPHVPDYLIRYDELTGTETGTYRVLSDHLGNVRLLVDTATGTIAQRLDYDEFGNVLVDSNPGFQPFGFGGGLWDSDDVGSPHPGTGFVRFGARDFDPARGRWVSKDELRFAGGETNPYAYVDDDPLNRTDPTGYQSDSLMPDGPPKLPLPFKLRSHGESRRGRTSATS